MFGRSVGVLLATAMGVVAINPNVSVVVGADEPPCVLPLRDACTVGWRAGQDDPNSENSSEQHFALLKKHIQSLEEGRRGGQ
jgi:hypothetical protein